MDKTIPDHTIPIVKKPCNTDFHETSIPLTSWSVGLCAPKPLKRKTISFAMADITFSKAHWITCAIFPKSIAEVGGGT